MAYAVCYALLYAVEQKAGALLFEIDVLHVAPYLQVGGVNRLRHYLLYAVFQRRLGRSSRKQVHAGAHLVERVFGLYVGGYYTLFRLFRVALYKQFGGLGLHYHGGYRMSGIVVYVLGDAVALLVHRRARELFVRLLQRRLARVGFGKRRRKPLAGAVKTHQPVGYEEVYHQNEHAEQAAAQYLHHGVVGGFAVVHPHPADDERGDEHAHAYAEYDEIELQVFAAHVKFGICKAVEHNAEVVGGYRRYEQQKEELNAVCDKFDFERFEHVEIEHDQRVEHDATQRKHYIREHRVGFRHILHADNYLHNGKGYGHRGAQPLAHPLDAYGEFNPVFHVSKCCL